MKSSYTVVKTFQETYTGGEIAWEKQSKCILCPTERKINLINKNGLVEATLQEGDEKIITSCALSGRIAVAYESEQVFIYTCTDAKWESVVKLKVKQVQFMEFSKDGALLAVASSDGSLKVFSVKGGYCTHNFTGHRGVVTRCWFDNTPKRYNLYSIDQECDIRRWDLVKKECIAVLSGHDSSVTSLALLDESTLVSAGRDKVLNVWDLKKNVLKKSLAVFEDIEALVTIPTTNKKSKNVIVSAGAKGILKLWDINNGKELSSFDPFLTKGIQTKTEAQIEESYIEYLINVDDNQVAVVNRAQMIAIVDMDVNSQKFSTSKTIVGWNDSILDLSFLKFPEELGGDCSNLIIASNSPSIRVLNTKTNSWTIVHGAHEGNILKISLSHNKEWLATSSADGILKVWKIFFEEPLRFELAGYATAHLEACSALQWSQKSNSFLISASADTTLKLWDTEPLKNWKFGQRPHQLVSSISLKAHEKEVNAVRISPNDKLLATASQDKTVKLWKLSKKSPFISDPITFSGHKRGVWNCAFSPIDKVLASCSTDQTIKLWSLDNGTCLRTFQGHSGSVLSVEFISPLGSQLLSSGADGVLKLWNIKEGECINSFTNHQEKIWTIAVVPDTSTNEIATGGDDSIITYWKDNTQEVEKQKKEESNKLIEGNQQLTNLIRTKSFQEAVKLAISLNHPRKLFLVFESCFNTDKSVFKEIIVSLNLAELEYIFLKIRDWNTHSKTAVVAQEILYVVFTTYRPSSLAKLPHMKQALQALIPYTERHITHLDTSIKDSYIIDYTLSNMNKWTGNPLMNDSNSHQLLIADHSENEENEGNAMDEDI